MRYFIIAGEQSGDLHGSNLVKELISADHNAEIFCWGGDLMESAGAKLLMHYAKTAFMGFVSVIRNLGTIRKNLALCKEQIIELKPDVVILIDYPGFNLRIAKFSREKGFRVFYYISPKLWAWNEKRVEKIRKFVDRMYIIFPFETGFYKKHGIDTVYRGNPLKDEIENRMAELPSGAELRKYLGIDDRPVIAMLAGSRKHEVELILPQMLKAVDRFPGYQFILAGVRNLPDELYSKLTGKHPVKLVKEKTYGILKAADAALVKSGTATLEAALMKIPQVVCYKGDFISMLIGWMVIKVKYISLVNLIMGREVVKELVQYDLTGKTLIKELNAILPGGEKRDLILAGYDELDQILGPAGTSRRVAEDMVREGRRGTGHRAQGREQESGE